MGNPHTPPRRIQPEELDALDQLNPHTTNEEDLLLIAEALPRLVAAARETETLRALVSRAATVLASLHERDCDYCEVVGADPRCGVLELIDQLTEE